MNVIEPRLFRGGALSTARSIACFMLCAAPVVAEPRLTLGVDYSYGDYTLEGRERTEVLTPEGPGLSASVSGEGPWSVSLAYSEQEDRKAVTRRFDLAYELNSVSFQISGSWLVGDYSRWVSLFWQRDEEVLRVIDTADLPDQRNYRENTETDSLGVEIGQAWEWPQWSPSIALSLTALGSDTTREFQSVQPGRNLLLAIDEEQDLEGLDAALSAGLDYYHSIGTTGLLIPSMGVTYQHSLSGEITGSSRTAWVSNRGRRTFAAEDGAQTVDGEDQLFLDLALSLLMGEWLGQLGYSQPLLEEPRDAQWIGSVSYRF